jgi:hypothetical protein
VVNEINAAVRGFDGPHQRSPWHCNLSEWTNPCERIERSLWVVHTVTNMSEECFGTADEPDVMLTGNPNYNIVSATRRQMTNNLTEELHLHLVCDP